MVETGRRLLSGGKPRARSAGGAVVLMAVRSASDAAAARREARWRVAWRRNARPGTTHWVDDELGGGAAVAGGQMGPGQCPCEATRSEARGETTCSTGGELGDGIATGGELGHGAPGPRQKDEAELKCSYLALRSPSAGNSSCRRHLSLPEPTSAVVPIPAYAATRVRRAPGSCYCRRPPLPPCPTCPTRASLHLNTLLSPLCPAIALFPTEARPLLLGTTAAPPSWATAPPPAASAKPSPSSDPAWGFPSSGNSSCSRSLPCQSPPPPLPTPVAAAELRRATRVHVPMRPRAEPSGTAKGPAKPLLGLWPWVQLGTLRKVALKDGTGEMGVVGPRMTSSGLARARSRQRAIGATPPPSSARACHSAHLLLHLRGLTQSRNLHLTPPRSWARATSRGHDPLPACHPRLRLSLAPRRWRPGAASQDAVRRPCAASPTCCGILWEAMQQLPIRNCGLAFSCDRLPPRRCALAEEQKKTKMMEISMLPPNSG